MTSESGLGPAGDLHLVVAALRTDRTDVESYARVLSDTLGDALPAGMVEVERRRTLADRMAGRDGRPVSVSVHATHRQLDLSAAAHGGVTAEIRQVVRGVVISRKEVGVDEWLAALAEELTQLAHRDARARAALARLLDV
jgi:hypothetical protein